MRSLVRRCPGVVAAGTAATCRRVRMGGVPYLLKTFMNSPEGLIAWQHELSARRLFAGAPWMSPIVRSGWRHIVIPFYPEASRLDIAVKNMDESTRWKIAKEAIHILFEMFLQGHAHCDFHSRNLFSVDGQLHVIDFEHMRRYPQDATPPFPESYDLTGRGLADAPVVTENMCYVATGADNLALEPTLGVPLSAALDLFKEDLKVQIQDVCNPARTDPGSGRSPDRYGCGSFSLPYFAVSRGQAAWDSQSRLRSVGLDRDAVSGKTVLDLASNIGGMLFQMQKFTPSRCVGVESSETKVDIAKCIAAYNGLRDVQFLLGDCGAAWREQLAGTFDVVLRLSSRVCRARSEDLCGWLGRITRERLYLQINGGTGVRQMSEQLRRCGFHNVRVREVPSDDEATEGDGQPLLVASK
jgi:hypothetical protein